MTVRGGSASDRRRGSKSATSSPGVVKSTITRSAPDAFSSNAGEPITVCNSIPWRFAESTTFEENIRSAVRNKTGKRMIELNTERNPGEPGAVDQLKG